MTPEISPAVAADLPEIDSFLQDIFGPRSDLPSLLQKWIDQPEYSLLRVRTPAGIVGLSTWSAKSGDLEKYACFGADALNFMREKKRAWTVNLAVAPAHRQRGLGYRLSRAQLPWLRGVGSEIVLGTSWVNGTADSSRHLFERAGFRLLGESRAFLRAQQPEDARCSACGKEACDCNSLLYGATTEPLFKMASSPSFNIR